MLHFERKASLFCGKDAKWGDRGAFDLLMLGAAIRRTNVSRAIAWLLRAQNGRRASIEVPEGLGFPC
jgi:hypothetical protein